MAITLSHHDIHTIRILACVSGSLSSFGATMLFLSFFLFTELRTYSSRLILYLSISDLGEAIAWALGPASDGHFACILQALGIQFFGVSSVLWQICIATYILQVCIGKKHMGRQEKYYHMICWGIPGAIIIGGGIGDIFGNSGAWCWVKHPHELLGLFLLYLPYMLSVPYCLFTYIYVDVIFKRRSKADLSTADRIALQRARHKLRSRFYLIPYAICWACGLINRANNAAGPNRIAALYILQASVFPLQGLWNFLMYGYTERIVGPQDIYEILEHSTHLKFFTDYLESIKAKENINCWMAINELKAINEADPNWGIEAKRVFEEYIDPNAPQAVNISSEQRAALSTLSMSGFINVQLEIVQLMNQNILHFKTSKHYKELVEELQAIEAIGGNSAGKSLLFSLYAKLRVFLQRGNRSFALTASSESI
eukprot:Phypoly_transcript_07567.p1 GENE.Phypoly_transcript_07567~~Phypoly_transcript_07567.p1  ORF type:complete len:426 (+),score=43.32 Phypoly_transcript_07567:280-1557(+)